METEINNQDASHNALPSNTQFIDHLISQLSGYKPHINPDVEGTAGPEPPQPQRQTPFSSLPASQLSKLKPLMLTLHCLFPNEFLLALDILDRGLVRRFLREPCSSSSEDDEMSLNLPEESNPNPNLNPKGDNSTFFVISGSALASTSPSSLFNLSHSRAEQKGYEVHLHAWNCTCPTFTLNAFRDPGPPSSEEREELSPDSDISFSFGGTLTQGSTKLAPPVCKHLLACLLMVRCPGLFAGKGDEGVVLSVGELAGWGAGWGG